MGIAVAFLPPNGIHMFFLCMAFLDGMLMLSTEWVRHLRQVENQDDEYRIIASIKPFLGDLSVALKEVFKTPIFDCVTTWACFILGIAATDQFGWTWRMVKFFPMKLFICDIINDTFYWTLHRYWHKPENYQTHKLHHTVNTPIAWVAAIMTTEEMFVTFLITRIVTPAIAFLLWGQWSTVEYLMYHSTLLAIEILGHSGQVHPGVNNTCRYGQAFLSESLGINLEIGHHDLHHELGNVNFGKRLCLMDKLFGTFKDHREKISRLERAKRKASTKTS